MKIVFNGHSGYLGMKGGIHIWDAIFPDPPQYYLKGNGSSTKDTIISSVSTNDMTMEYIFNYAGSEGDFICVGSDDNHDFRTFTAFGNIYFDAGSGRANTGVGGVGFDSNKDYHVFMQMYNNQCSCRVTDVATGLVIWSPSYTNSNNIAGTLFARARKNSRIYYLKVGDHNGVTFDGIVTANGLYDNISGNTITMSNFTPVKIE